MELSLISLLQSLPKFDPLVSSYSSTLKNITSTTTFLISSSLCDCNILLTTLPDPTTDPLQSILISAARVIPLNHKSCHSSVPRSNSRHPTQSKIQGLSMAYKVGMVWPLPCTTFPLNYSDNTDSDHHTQIILTDLVHLRAFACT